ncbi:MAG TPA: hypothetical protein VGE40_06875, partial [Bacilli bacterium]
GVGFIVGDGVNEQSIIAGSQSNVDDVGVGDGFLVGVGVGFIVGDGFLVGVGVGCIVGDGFFVGVGVGFIVGDGFLVGVGVGFIEEVGFGVDSLLTNLIASAIT